MRATAHQFGYVQFAGQRGRFQAAHRDGIGERQPDGRVSMQFPADLEDFTAVAWLVLSDGLVDESQWGDVDMGWLVSVLLDEGMDTITTLRTQLTDPAHLDQLDHDQRDLLDRVRAHVIGLFTGVTLGSTTVSRATRAAVRRAADDLTTTPAAIAAPGVVVDLDDLVGAR
ncbi:hypothetical protein FVA95_26900 [Pseudonocardia sp. EV170527-09]|uniref:hypothetical protein n=1 Tax=Pseudonocardia sp. EV170527-09 TaxID=2603411 RepID=UPI0011F12301|nr:hypothetical protein [Pseudonocardia sp. EV170527-09]KAA1013324.1 hypothetical protein FVA95_26900 [Pseudonocardia sp. EV170527-09]